MNKRKKSPTPGRRFIGYLFLGIAILVLCFIGYAVILARIVHVERVVLSVPDLPAEFDGLKILYVSDIDMVGLTTVSGVARFFNHLEALDPDILILGGDYACYSLMNTINKTSFPEVLSVKRRALFTALADFDAPMGKFAVAGENDADAVDLSAELALGGIAFLSDSGTTLERAGAQIAIVGLSDDSSRKTDYGSISSRFTKNDFVIVAAHNPASIAGVLTAEAEDAGAWCDLVLTGHTHGGQIILFGRPMRTFSVRESRYLSGWHKKSETFLLVSEGLGCEFVNLRFGSEPQVHLITLKCSGS